MSTPTAVPAALRDHVDALLDAEFARLDALRTEDTIDAVRRQVLATLDAPVHPLTAYGAHAYVSKRYHVVKAARLVATRFPDGRTVYTQERTGLRKRDSETRAPYHVQSTWTQMSWDEIDECVRRFSDAAETADTTLRVWKHRQFLRTVYPDAATPLDACQQAGIDPDAYDAAVIGPLAI